MQETEQTVFVVDDDEAVRKAVTLLIRSVGLKAEAHDSAASFLNSFDVKRGGCLVLDIRMPGMSGIELHEHLRAQGMHLPVIFITGHGDVAMAVRAMKAGAYDFVEKPFNDQDLLDRVQKALRSDLERRNAESGQEAIRARLDRLTPREREIMDRIVSGQANKVIAVELSLSERTVELHRSRVMEKMEAGSLAELVTMAMRLRGRP